MFAHQMSIWLNWGTVHRQGHHEPVMWPRTKEHWVRHCVRLHGHFQIDWPGLPSIHSSKCLDGCTMLSLNQSIFLLKGNIRRLIKGQGMSAEVICVQQESVKVNSCTLLYNHMQWPSKNPLMVVIMIHEWLIFKSLFYFITLQLNTNTN